MDIFMETSAKSGFNVDKLMFQIGKILYNFSKENNQVDKVRKYYNVIFTCLFQEIDNDIYSQIRKTNKENQNIKCYC